MDFLKNGGSSPPNSPIPSESEHVSAVFFLYMKCFQIDVTQKVTSLIAAGLLLLRESLVMADGGWDNHEDLSGKTVPETV